MKHIPNKLIKLENNQFSGRTSWTWTTSNFLKCYSWITLVYFFSSLFMNQDSWQDFRKCCISLRWFHFIFSLPGEVRRNKGQWHNCIPLCGVNWLAKQIRNNMKSWRADLFTVNKQNEKSGNCPTTKSFFKSINNPL